MPIRTALVFDIETAGHACASEFIPTPDLDAIAPGRNLRDPAKIAEDMARRRAEALADYQASMSRCALDWNLSRIVAIGWAHEPDLAVVARAIPDETAEIGVLEEFWALARHADLIGFAARTFDLPTLIQRSRLLGVKAPPISLGRFGRGDVTDLRDLLTFDDARYEAIMPRSLKAFCRRFGIPVTDAIGGDQIGQLVAEGRWEDVIAHVTSDVTLTLAMAQRLRVIDPALRPQVSEPDPVV